MHCRFQKNYLCAVWNFEVATHAAPQVSCGVQFFPSLHAAARGRCLVDPISRFNLPCPRQKPGPPPRLALRHVDQVTGALDPHPNPLPVIKSEITSDLSSRKVMGTCWRGWRDGEYVHWRRWRLGSSRTGTLPNESLVRRQLGENHFLTFLIFSGSRV